MCKNYLHPQDIQSFSRYLCLSFQRINFNWFLSQLLEIKTQKILWFITSMIKVPGIFWTPVNTNARSSTLLSILCAAPISIYHRSISRRGVIITWGWYWRTSPAWANPRVSIRFRELTAFWVKGPCIVKLVVATHLMESSLSAFLLTTSQIFYSEYLKYMI